MHLIPHWIPLVASLGLLAGGSSASAAEEAFDLWNECAKACVLDLKDGVRSSRMSVDPAIADPNGQGVLHYSMVLEGGNDALKLAIDNALSITSDGLTIRLEGGVEPNKPVRYSYTRQARGSWSLNWLVPIGHEKPSNIKVFIHELNAGNQLSHMSPIYTIEMGDELLAKLARDATFFVRAHESNEMQPTLAISHAGVSVVMAQAQPRREKRWSEWASGKVLCLLDPLDGVYNYLAQQRCKLDDTWEGKIYRVLAGNPAKHDLDIKPTVISHRLHFPEGGSLAALTAHQACHLPLETFTRHRQPRGWEQLEQCGYPVQRLVALYLASALASLTAVAYLGGFWLGLLATGAPPSANGQVLCGALLLALGLAVNLLGINPLKYFVNAGIVAEAIASIGIGVLLLLFFRNHPLDLLFSGPGGTGDADGSYLDGVLTALAVGGWAFLGFDACSQISEETTDARVSTPRAILRSMLVVGFTVMLTAFAVTLSYQDIGAVVSGQVVDPVTPAVVDAFGAWAERPFVAVVLIAFVACVVSVQTYIGRAIFGMARDAILPGSALLRRVDRRKVPMAAMVCSTLLASLGLALGLNATAVGTLIAFGSGGFFVVFLIVAACALWARLVGRWDPDKGALRLGRAGLAVNVLAVAWLSFEALNVAWPRASLAPPDAPWFQVWAVVVVFSALAAFGLLYMVIAKPHRRIATSLSFAAPPAD